MIKNLFLFFTYLLVLNTFPQILHAQDSDEDLEENKKNLEQQFDATKQFIVMINVELDGAQEFGAGIIVGRKKDELLIATAYHFLHNGGDKANKISVKLRARPSQSLEATILKYSHEDTIDLALLSIKNLSKAGINVLAAPFNSSVEASSVKRGDLVFPLGNPTGISWAMPVAPDKVADTLENIISFQSSFIARGHSGGALLDDHAGITGLITADGQPFGRAISIDAVISKIKQWGYPVQLLVKYEDGEPLLHLAASKGDLAKIKNLVTDELVNVDQRDHHMATALHHAAAYATTKVVTLLINSGADINALDADGDPPVEWAMETGKTENVKLLVKNGAKTETKNNSGKSLIAGWTPLIVAIIKEDFGAIKTLLAKGENVNQGDDHKVTPLHYAAAYSNTELITLLINGGAEINALDKNYKKPVIWAVESGKIENVKFFINKQSIKIGEKRVNSFDKELLDFAVKKGHVEIAKFLLTSGMDVNSEFGLNPPLVRAAISGQYEMTEFLLKSGANINLPGVFNRTPFFHAVTKGNVELMKLLIRSGADVNIKQEFDDKYFSPLHALFNDHQLNKQKLKPDVVFEALKILIAAGADVNARDEKGLRPLNYALANGYNAAADFLRLHGAK